MLGGTRHYQHYERYMAIIGVMDIIRGDHIPLGYILGVYPYYIDNFDLFIDDAHPAILTQSPCCPFGCNCQLACNFEICHTLHRFTELSVVQTILPINNMYPIIFLCIIYFTSFP